MGAGGGCGKEGESDVLSHFGVDTKGELSEFEAIAARHPVFRIAAAD